MIGAMRGASLRVAATVAVCGWTAAVAAGTDIVVETRAETVLAASVCRLGDIAEVHSDDAAVAQSLRAIVIGRAPKVGQMGYVSRIDLEAHVRSRLGTDASAVRWNGPFVMKLRAVGRELAAQDMTAAAEAELREWLREQVGTAEVRPSGAVQRVSVPDGEIEIRAGLNPRARLTKKMSVWVDVFVDGALYRTVPLWFDVSTMGRVYQAQRDLPAGHALTRDDLTLAEVDLATVKGKPWDSGTEVAGLRTRKWLAAHAVLTEQSVEPVPAVVKGQPLTVLATSGTVALQVTAVALADGEVSDIIPAIRRQGQEEFEVRVTGKGQAVVTDGAEDEY